MITITYLLCIALKGMQWPLWGIIGTGIIDYCIAEAFTFTKIYNIKENETDRDNNRAE